MLLLKNEKVQNTLEFIAKSKWIDWIGVAIILIGGYISGWFTETLGMVNKNVPTWALFIPFGIISTLSSCFSLISDRLDARLNKWANWLSLFQTVVAMWIDANLGNNSAYITYPITFIVYLFAIHNWAKIGEDKIAKPLTDKKAKIVAIVSIVVATLFSAGTNYIGFQNFSPLYWLTTVVFAMSLIANIYSALKLDTQWGYWIVYNFVQLAKNIIQLNPVNSLKYLYYIVNSLAGKAYWFARRPKNNK